ncbi:hypothetical protein BT93_D1310 [Corymbia citriodora subsp. variegata]|nr:hypothetical protein BT93_D1310 [Corymbia citriodora subsp. variegata]KAF8032349.1 hypothetical protein BT93_D1310 [Corymbia citriodora subsp. variegata]
MCSEISIGILGTRSGWGSWWKMSILSLGLYAAIRGWALINGDPTRSNSVNRSNHIKRTGKSAPIKPISPKIKREKLLWLEAEKRKRKTKREECIRDNKVEELSRLRALLAEGHLFCDMLALADRDSILIRGTYFENSYASHSKGISMGGYFEDFNVKGF